jgi:hypothetical protein
VHPASRPERTISQVVETLFRPDDHHNPLHFAVLVRIALAYPADSMTSTVLGEDNPEVSIGVKKGRQESRWAEIKSQRSRALVFYWPHVLIFQTGLSITRGPAAV